MICGMLKAKRMLDKDIHLASYLRSAQKEFASLPPLLSVRPDADIPEGPEKLVRWPLARFEEMPSLQHGNPGRRTYSA